MAYIYTPYTYKVPITPLDDFVGENRYNNAQDWWGTSSKPSQTGAMNFGQRWNNDNPIMDKTTPVQPKPVKTYMERIASNPPSHHLHVLESQSTRLVFD